MYSRRLGRLHRVYLQPVHREERSRAFWDGEVNAIRKSLFPKNLLKVFGFRATESELLAIHLLSRAIQFAVDFLPPADQLSGSRHTPVI